MHYIYTFTPPSLYIIQKKTRFELKKCFGRALLHTAAAGLLEAIKMARLIDSRKWLMAFFTAYHQNY